MNIMRIPEKGRAGTALSMNATFNGAAILVERMKSISIFVAVVETSATLAGDLKLQASNNAFKDNCGNEVNASADWIDIASSTKAVSGTGNHMWIIDDANYEALRIVWTRTSGQGTGTPYILAKDE